MRQVSIVDQTLDHDCLHCQLALPIQHFIDRHPDKTREKLIREACEMVAELIGSSTPSKSDSLRLLAMAVDYMREQTTKKFRAYAEMRQSSLM